MVLLFISVWLGSNAYRRFVGPPHLQANAVPWTQPPSASDEADFIDLESDPTVVSISFELIENGGHPADRYYAEDASPNFRTCQQMCANDLRCSIVSFNPTGGIVADERGNTENACARYDNSATDSRMVQGPQSTWRCVRKRGGVPPVHRPPPSERDKAVAVVFAGVHPHVQFAKSELLESQTLLLNTLIWEYQRVDIFFCVEPRHVQDVQRFRFPVEAGFARELFPTAVFGQQGVKGMFGRFRACWVQVARYAAAHNATYQWIVRTRPDLFFLGLLRPTLQLENQNAIYARGRRFGPRWDRIRGEEVSYWDYYDICGGVAREKYSCRWFDDPQRADPSGNCMVIDDQFALIPPHLAPFCESTVHCFIPLEDQTRLTFHVA